MWQKHNTFSAAQRSQRHTTQPGVGAVNVRHAKSFANTAIVTEICCV
jgi:hypothetical protein